MTEKPKFALPIVPSDQKTQALTKGLLQNAQGFTITTEDHYLASWGYVEAHDRAIGKINEMWDPFISGLHAMHKAAIKLRDTFLKPVTDSKERLMNLRSTYRQKQEEEDRKKREAAAALLRKQEVKQLEKDAKQLEKAGQPESAAVLREQAATAPLPFIPPAPVVRQAGSVITKRWKFEITDPDLVDRKFCSPDEKIIRPIVNALGDKANIAGVRVWAEEAESSRAVKP